MQHEVVARRQGRLEMRRVSKSQQRVATSSGVSIGAAKLFVEVCLCGKKEVESTQRFEAGGGRARVSLA